MFVKIRLLISNVKSGYVHKASETDVFKELVYYLRLDTSLFFLRNVNYSYNYFCSDTYNKTTTS